MPRFVNVDESETSDPQYTFASLISRDSTYDVMMNIWRLCNPNAVMSTTSFAPGGHSRPASIADEPANTADTSGKSPTRGHAKTQCQCGKDGKHYSEVAMDATFHSTPEKVYNLMFNSEWFKTFLSDNQKLRGASQVGIMTRTDARRGDVGLAAVA